MRKATVSFHNLRLGQIGLESCDGETPFKTVKNCENWNEKGEWTGKGEMEMIRQAIEELIGKA